MATDTTTDLVITDAEIVDEDPSTGSEIAKTLAVGATSTVVVAGTVLAYHYLKPRVIAAIYRRRHNGESPMYVDSTILKDPQPEKA